MLKSTILSLLFACMLFEQISFGSESLRVPGGNCTEPEAIYNYSSDQIKTPWKLNELYAVPVGTTDPSEWDLSPYFKTQFEDELGAGESPEAYAAACASVWGDYFTSNASVLLTIRRTITTTHKTLKCESGSWATLSTENVEIDDVSDWLSTNAAAYDVNAADTQTLLRTDLESLLNNLNGQPGSD